MDEVQQLQVVNSNEALEVLNRSEVDMQIATAKKYPRNLTAVVNEIKSIATLDPETAAECFYCLPRNGKNIEGPSVRMAEIMVSAWGNMRIAKRIVGNDGKTVTAQAVCMDLEKNTAVSLETKRRITDKAGKTFSDDMQVVTGNAATAIAFRNAVFTIIPKAVTKKVMDEVKAVAIGTAIDMTTRRERCLSFFRGKGIKDDMLFKFMEVKGIEDLDSDKIFTLAGLANAIREGDTTVEESIIEPLKEREREELAAKEHKSNEDKVKEAMAANG